MLTKMKAIIIRGIHTHVMDAAVREPHSMEDRPTLREQIHKGGFITIISTKETSKWIGIAQNTETASNWVNKNMKDLCAAVYNDGTAPVANEPETKIRKHRSQRGPSAEKCALFDQQSKSWADITRHDQDADSGNFTASSIAKRIPTVVRFQSKVRFDIVDVLVDNTKPDLDDETKMTATDGLTTITQDDLRTMKDELSAQFKDEISSAISEMSNNSEARTSNDQLQKTINDQITQHNNAMLENMQSMRSMMQSMQTFVENTLSLKSDGNISDASAFRDSRQTHSDDDSPGPSSPESNLLTQPSKRSRTPSSKGQPPLSKLARDISGRGGGRGRGAGGRVRSPPRRSARKTAPTTNFDPTKSDNRKPAPATTSAPKASDTQPNNTFDPMEVTAPPKTRRQPFGTATNAFAAASKNRYDPLTESDAPSVSGSL
jgi:hypothetical protein